MRFHLDPGKKEWRLICDSPTFQDYLGEPIRFNVNLSVVDDARFLDDKYECWVEDLGWRERHELSEPYLTLNLDAWDYVPSDFTDFQGRVTGWEFKLIGFRSYEQAAYDLVIWVVEVSDEDLLVHVRLIERRFID